MRRPALSLQTPPRGFTLIEVLIALAIVSIALAAFMRVTGVSTSNLDRVQQQSLALTAAENRLMELQMGQSLAAGVHLGDCSQGDQPFVCRLSVGPTHGGLRAVRVEVYPGRDTDRRLAALQTQLPEAP